MSTIIRSLPADFQQNLAAPKKIEKQFMQALTAANLMFDTSKTFSGVERFDTKVATGVNRITFFDGSSAFPFDSNVQGTVKPNSEHDYYYAIRFSHIDGDVSKAFIPGLPNDEAIVGGLLNLSVNGVVMLSNVPLTEIMGINQDNTEQISGIYLLKVPIWWPGQTSIRFELIFPNAVPTLDVKLRASFIGVGLIS